MKHGESNKSSGFGVETMKAVSATNHKAPSGSGGDVKESGTVQAFKAAQNNTSKA